MPTNDFECRTCKHVITDVFYTADKPARWKKCTECGKRAYPTWKKDFNKKRTLKDVLGTAPWHPQIGPRDDIHTIDDFHRVCREMGMEEGNDPVGGNRNWRQEQQQRMERQQQRRAERRKEYSPVTTATPEQVRDAEQASRRGMPGLLEG